MKTHTKHTKGPWHVATYGCSPDYYAIKKGPFTLATKITTEQDARLIAAAPELLAELHSVRVQLEAQALGYSASEIWPHVRTEIVRRISHAIQKVEGNA